MELILVRHGLPVRQAAASGAADPELAPEGRQQAERLAQYLAVEGVDALYTSPMRRAVETAAPLAATAGLTPVTVEEIAEFDRHAAEYVPVEELKAAGDPRWHRLMAGEWEETSESPETFRTRVIEGLEGIIAAHCAQRVVAVCHGGVINQYIAHILGISTTVGFFYPQYTSIHRVSAARSGERSLSSLNETAHLRVF